MRVFLKRSNYKSAYSGLDSPYAKIPKNNYKVFIHMKKHLLAVGIVTNNRRDILLRLLDELHKQAEDLLDVIINENGSDVLSETDFDGYPHLHIALLKDQNANIPRARNRIIKRAIHNYQWLVFIDDDCVPTKNWLDTICNFLSRTPPSRFWAVQGVSISIPLDNPYGQVSGLLYKLWFDVNTAGNTLAILDTKCCALNLNCMEASGLRFNETIQYGSDIDLGSRMIHIDRKKQIYVFNKWKVFHEERKDFIHFVCHRTRLSIAFRMIRNKYPDDLASVGLNTKLRFLWSLNLSLTDKIKIFVAMTIAGALSIMGLWTKQSKFFH